MSTKIQLTPAQQNAVDICDRTLLVSAAAGSGKTAVLTQKIIKLVTDSEKRVNISDLLVVTFTKAAATELKERISKAIYDALKENPTDKHLSKQLVLLGKAKISTIHSFCSELIKSNFQVLGLPSTLRIGDETETGLICDNKLNELIEECYGGLHSKSIENFEDFSECFLMGKTDNNLSFDFKNIYKKLCNYPEGIELLKKSSAELLEASSGSPLDNKWGSVVRAHIKRVFNYYYSKFTSSCELFAGDAVFAEKLLPGFEESSRYCYSVLSVIDAGSYDELKAILLTYEPSKLKNLKAEQKTTESEYYRGIRTAFKKQVEKLYSRYFSFSEKTVKQQFTSLADINMKLYNFLSIFEKLYSEEKLRRGILDYNDLERLSLKLLYTDVSCGALSEFALNIRDKYKYIFIDEYQDVNELQDKIFSAISTPTNRFMVGDIKQSIYGFRGAEPSLFSEYRSIFPEYKETENNSEGLTIYLSDNFRSDKTVIGFSNAVFEVLFNNNSGKAPYTAGDRLVCSKRYEEGEQDYNVRMCLMEDDEENKGYINEAEFVASEIEKLVKSGKEPSEIAILLRAKGKAVFYEDALKRRNISSFNQENRGLFENDAVLLLLCLLNTIDNPSRDIYLTGAMKSPLFNFTLSEITEIRLSYSKGTMFDAVRRYAEEKNSLKAERFIEKVNEWRIYAEGCPVDRLIRHIYNETHIVELLSGKKESDSDVERQANLLLLYEYARQFENGSFKGLYNFILYLNDVLEKRTELANAKIVSEGKGVVNIMTIHNSKGLEFDTVFLCDTGHLLNRNDEKNQYVLRKDLGMTLTLRDSTSFAKFKTLPRYASEILIREDALDEELRVLYVALTRAKKRLIITSSAKNPRKKVEEISSAEAVVSQHQLMECQSFMELILWGILKSDYHDYTIEYISQNREVKDEDCGEEIEKIYDDALVNEYKKIIDERLSYEYSEPEYTKMPTKLSVSKLYPGILDEYTTDASESAPSMYVRPRFLSGDKSSATGADRGTATHIFMQFCDFDRVAEKGVDSELAYLENKGFIDKRSAELVNVEKVKAFFKSELYKGVKSARKVWREKRFNIKLPASEFVTESELKAKLKSEKVLVQGVIDLLFETEDGKLVLADYKTDYFSEKDIESGKAEETLIERHKTQLVYYAEACKHLLGRDVDRVVIYSFALDKTIKII